MTNEILLIGNSVKKIKTIIFFAIVLLLNYEVFVTILAQTFHMRKCLVKILWTLNLFKYHCSLIILNVKRLSDLIRLFIRSMFFSVFEVEGLPERWSSSARSLTSKMICAREKREIGIKNVPHRPAWTFQNHTCRFTKLNTALLHFAWRRTITQYHYSSDKNHVVNRRSCNPHWAMGGYWYTGKRSSNSAVLPNRLQCCNLITFLPHLVYILQFTFKKNKTRLGYCVKRLCDDTGMGFTILATDYFYSIILVHFKF